MVQSTNNSYNAMFSMHIPLKIDTSSSPSDWLQIHSSKVEMVANCELLGSNFFERADNFLSTNGGSLASSRAGTMTSNLGSNEGSMTPSTIISPLNLGGRFNANGNGKSAF